MSLYSSVHLLLELGLEQPVDMSQPQDPHSQFVTHPNGQKTHFIVDDFTDPWTPTETILIQPGFGRHSAFWYHWIPALARKYRVIRRDLRGHGFSSCPPPNYDYSLDTVLGEIVDLLDQLRIEKVHLLGESTGGLVTIAFAAKFRFRTLSLTTCATPTHLPQSAQLEWARGLKDWETAARTMGSKGYIKSLLSLPGSIGQAEETPYSKWWIDQIGISTGEGFARYAGFLAKLDTMPFYPEIEKSGIPVLILAPTASRWATPEDQKKMRQLFKGSVFVEVDGKGHEIFVDKAEECQEALLDFLEKLKR